MCGNTEHPIGCMWLGPTHQAPDYAEINRQTNELVEAARRALQKEQQMVRGKFTLQSVAKVSWSPTAQVFKFGAVHDTVTEENSRFAKYTPSGQLEMTVDNPPAQEFFELGKNYYLDFSKAE